MRSVGFVAVTALLALSACGGRGTGGTSEAANVACEGDDVCTVTYPAKARNNQSSTGGPPAQVLGVETRLFSISGGQANFRIADEPVTLEAGKKKTVAGLTVQATEIIDTQVVVKISKAKAKATPKATAKAKS